MDTSLVITLRLVLITHTGDAIRLQYAVRATLSSVKVQVLYVTTGQRTPSLVKYDGNQGSLGLPHRKQHTSMLSVGMVIREVSLIAQATFWCKRKTAALTLTQHGFEARSTGFIGAYGRAD
jgi:hypothetical protein